MKTPLPQYKEDAIALVHALMGVFDIEHTLEVNKMPYPTKIRHAMLLAGFSNMCGKPDLSVFFNPNFKHIDKSFWDLVEIAHPAPNLHVTFPKDKYIDREHTTDR
ncbi:hypothetical protein IFM89_015555 [Coptis chinensis]|uniref:Uncharacterized protein n=1 Tax=Coptis chinensis TaxID=261450 RepID=A0A835LVS1_9MAGN|nr:hypothetical protein IFM89_015555 [Coptis chinensis]